MPSDADLIEQTAREILGGDGMKNVMSLSYVDTTLFVKKTFGDLGKRLGYLVAASGYPDRDYDGWLYDMVWYVSAPVSRMLVWLPMILESELHLGKLANVAQVNPDFEKLIQARAGVRVWVAAIANEDLSSQHLTNCKQQISAFSGSTPEDIYIFIIYIFSIKSTLVERFQMSNA